MTSNELLEGAGAFALFFIFLSSSLIAGDGRILGTSESFTSIFCSSL